MKKILCALMVLAATHSYTACQAKVRVAAHAITQVGRAALQAAKANKFRTAMLTSTLTFAGYAKYRHGWYDRELARLEKLQKQRQAYKHKTVHSSLSSNKNHGHCPNGIADLINAYAGADEQDLKIEAEIKKARAAAAIAREISFKKYSIDLRANRLRRNFGQFMFDEVTVGIISLSPLITFSSSFITFSILKLLRLKAYANIPSSPVSWIPNKSWDIFDGEVIQIHSWREMFYYSAAEAKQLLKMVPFLTGACVTFATIFNTKAWLDERDNRVKFAQWQTRPEKPSDPWWRQQAAHADEATRERLYRKWLREGSPA